MSLPNLTNSVVWVNPSKDNVAVAKHNLPTGLVISDNSCTITLKTNIPGGHHVAITDIPEGEKIWQYGQPFSVSCGIQAGDLVSEKNTKNLPENINKKVPRILSPLTKWQGDIPMFQGFLRPDKLAGTRNWVVIIPTSMCSSHEARVIADSAENNGMYTRQKYNNVDGVTFIPHTFGCGCMDQNPGNQPQQLGELKTTLSMFHKVMSHPNVGAVLLVELGCEKANLATLTRWITGNSDNPADLAAAVHKPVEYISIQESGGTKATIQKGLFALERLLAEANKNRRQPISLEKLALGLKCGGSDSFSGITANPALGEASDLLVRVGGNSIISEIPEFFGAEHLFAARAINDEVEAEIFSSIERFRKYLQTSGGNFEDNPSPGNRAGGLLNITIKALGAIAKSGQAPVSGVLNYLEPIWNYPQGGLYLLYGPGYDQVSTPALVASGAQIVCFTTGRGTGIGNAIAPVIKIASNNDLMNRMHADIDVNAGKILDGDTSIEKVGNEIFQKIVQVASGEIVKAEENRHREFNIWSEERITL